jgi:hypothetical protein
MRVHCRFSLSKYLQTPTDNQATLDAKVNVFTALALCLLIFVPMGIPLAIAASGVLPLHIWVVTLAAALAHLSWTKKVAIARHVFAVTLIIIIPLHWFVVGGFHETEIGWTGMVTALGALHVANSRLIPICGALSLLEMLCCVVYEVVFGAPEPRLQHSWAVDMLSFIFCICMVLLVSRRLFEYTDKTAFLESAMKNQVVPSLVDVCSGASGAREPGRGRNRYELENEP